MQQGQVCRMFHFSAPTAKRTELCQIKPSPGQVTRGRSRSSHLGQRKGNTETHFGYPSLRQSTPLPWALKATNLVCTFYKLLIPDTPKPRSPSRVAEGPGESLWLGWRRGVAASAGALPAGRAGILALPKRVKKKEERRRDSKFGPCKLHVRSGRFLRCSIFC